MLNSQNQILFVAEVDSKIVGTASCATSNIKRLSHRGSIGLCVQKKFWNQGIATSFMEHLIKFGFEKIGTFEGDYEIDNELIDVDYMNLKL